MISYFDINFPFIIDPPKTKGRLYRSTKPKIDKEKKKRLRKLSNKSKRINRK